MYLIASELLQNMRVFSRHKLIVNVLKTGIEQLELLENVGIFQMAVLVRNDRTD